MNTSYLTKKQIKTTDGATIEAGHRIDFSRLSGSLEDSYLKDAAIEVITPIAETTATTLPTENIPYGGGAAISSNVDAIARANVDAIAKPVGTSIAAGSTTYAANQLWANNTGAPVVIPNPATAATMAAAGFTATPTVQIEEILYVTADVTGNAAGAGQDKAIRIAPYTEFFRDAAGNWAANATDPASAQVTLAALPADTWTAVPTVAGIADPTDLAIYNAAGVQIQDQVARRKVGTVFQIASSTALTNLTIEVFS